MKNIGYRTYNKNINITKKAELPGYQTKSHETFRLQAS